MNRKEGSTHISTDWHTCHVRTTPASLFLPPPTSLSSLQLFWMSPPPSSLSTHPPSDFTVHQGWLELNMWPFNEEFVAQKNCNYCRCSNSILHPSSSPCFIHTLFLWRRGGGGTLRSLYLALIPICALKRQTVFPQTTTPPPLPFAPLSQEATRLSSISHATSYVVEMLILHNSVLFPTLKLFVFSAFWGSQSQIFRAKWIKQQN